MRIHVQDFSGHPFQVQLSRTLASRGHKVLHSYSAEYSTGHGRLELGPEDPSTLSFRAIRTGRPFDKYSKFARARFEYAYARALGGVVRNWAADVTVLCNVPLLALSRASSRLRRARAPYVYWHQDVYSVAMTTEFERTIPRAAAAPMSRYVQTLEKTVLRNANGVVAIANSFMSKYDEWGLALSNVDVIPNWAPIDEIAPGEQANPWAEKHACSDFVLMYAGTLGRKHNPLLLLRLLEKIRQRGIDAELLVASEGAGAEELRQASMGNRHVRILPFQPAQELSSMLAAGSVLLALLEPEASQFSVPSKVASYLSAGRPVVLLGPEENAAAANLLAAGGFVAEPTTAGVDAAASWIYELAWDRGRCEQVGKEARAYAERTYDVRVVADRFEDVLRRAVSTD